MKCNFLETHVSLGALTTSKIQLSNNQHARLKHKIDKLKNQHHQNNSLEASISPLLMMSKHHVDDYLLPLKLGIQEVIHIVSMFLARHIHNQTLINKKHMS